MFEFQYAGDSYHGCTSRGPKENRLNIFNWSLKHCLMELTLLRMIWFNQQIHWRWKTFPEDHSSSYDWITRLWLYVFWDGFYTRKSQHGGVYVKVHFLSFFMSESWTRSIVCPCGLSFWQPRKGHEKWDEMYFECQRIKFQWKRGSKFSHMLMVRARVA